MKRGCDKGSAEKFYSKYYSKLNADSHEHSCPMHNHSHGNEGEQSHDHSHAHFHEEHSHDHHDHHDHEEEGHHHHSICGCLSHDHGHDHDHSENENIYGVFLHILADALGSVGVIISSFFVKYYDIYVADAICSFIISLLILGSVMPLIQMSSKTLILGVGKPKKLENCEKVLKGIVEI